MTPDQRDSIMIRLIGIFTLQPNLTKHVGQIMNGCQSQLQLWDDRIEMALLEINGDRVVQTFRVSDHDSWRRCVARSKRPMQSISSEVRMDEKPSISPRNEKEPHLATIHLTVTRRPRQNRDPTDSFSPGRLAWPNPRGPANPIPCRPPATAAPIVWFVSIVVMSGRACGGGVVADLSSRQRAVRRY